MTFAMDVTWILTIIILHLLIIQTEGADQCHCATPSSCDTYPDGTCTFCEQYWSGPNCQIYNSAREDLNSTRLSWGDSDPHIVVDGEKSYDVSQKCTTISDISGVQATWSVILNRKRKVYRMKIYHYSGFAESMRIFEVRVNAELCIRSSTSSNPPPVLDITCGQPLTGDMVSITIPVSQFQVNTLALCEVEIYDCGDFWYDKQCDKRCNCVDINEVCDKINGSCTSGIRETTTASTTSPRTTPPPTASTTSPRTTPAANNSLMFSTAPTSKLGESDDVSTGKVFVARTTPWPMSSNPVDPNDSITLGEIVGVVVGVVVGLAVIVVVAAVIIYKMQCTGRPKVPDMSPASVRPPDMKIASVRPPFPPPRPPNEKPLDGEPTVKSSTTSNGQYAPTVLKETDHTYTELVVYEELDPEQRYADPRQPICNEEYLEPTISNNLKNF